MTVNRTISFDMGRIADLWITESKYQIVWWHYHDYGRGHNFCLQKSRMPNGRIGILLKYVSIYLDDMLHYIWLADFGPSKNLDVESCHVETNIPITICHGNKGKNEAKTQQHHEI